MSDFKYITFTRDQLEQMLDEIANYNIELAEDPTQPDLGIKYLQRVLAQCRHYLNRTNYYLQQIRRYEKGLRNEVKMLDLDLEFKMKEKLADDPIVRKQPSVEDRKAVAASMLRDEYEKLSNLRVVLQDVEETTKLIKTKLDELKGTNTDIKLQRHLVRDDKLDQIHGDEGYNPVKINKDKTIANGMPPPVTSEVIDPKDLLDPNKRPDDLPQPVDGVHAQMIADFFSSMPKKMDSPKPKTDDETAVAAKTVDYDDLLS